VRGTMNRAIAWAARAAMVAGGAVLIGCVLGSDPRWTERHVLSSYCATSMTERVAARALPWMVGALAAGSLVLAVPALARRLRRSSPRAVAALLASLAIAVGASLGVVELVMRWQYERLALGAGHAPGQREALPLVRVDPRLGWSHVPGRTTWLELGGRRISYAIDADGDRAASPEHRADPDKPTILVAGESIAFGYGLPYEETFTSLLERELGIQTVNLAVVGYGNDQAHLRVLDALARYRRPVAVVTFFVPRQIRRNVDIWRMRLALGPDDALVPTPPSSGPRIAKLLQVLPYHGDDARRVTAAILRATGDAARARGAFPLFVVTNYGRQCLGEGGAEAWILDELFARQGLAFVRVDLEAEDLLPGVFEHHPSLRGTRRIADAVAGALSERLGAALATPMSAGPR